LDPSARFLKGFEAQLLCNQAQHCGARRNWAQPVKAGAEHKDFTSCSISASFSPERAAFESAVAMFSKIYCEVRQLSIVWLTGSSTGQDLLSTDKSLFLYFIFMAKPAMIERRPQPTFRGVPKMIRRQAKLSSLFSLVATLVAAVPALAGPSPGQIQPLECGDGKAFIQEHGGIYTIGGQRYIRAKITKDGTAGYYVSKLRYQQLTNYHQEGGMHGKTVEVICNPHGTPLANITARFQFKPHASNELVTVTKTFSEFEETPFREHQNVPDWKHYRISLENLWGKNPGIPNLQSMSVTSSKPGEIHIGSITIVMLNHDSVLPVTEVEPTTIVIQKVGCEVLNNLK
jgi:hypothetical protein